VRCEERGDQQEKWKKSVSKFLKCIGEEKKKESGREVGGGFYTSGLQTLQRHVQARCIYRTHCRRTDLRERSETKLKTSGKGSTRTEQRKLSVCLTEKRTVM
jgi:hypothetical protein